MNAGLTIYQCGNEECSGDEIEVTVMLPRAAIHRGDPFLSDPPEDGWINPTHCPHCGTAISEELCREQVRND